MNSREMHAIQDIERFASEIDDYSRPHPPFEVMREGRNYLMVSALKPVRPIWLCVRLLAKILRLGVLIFDKLDSIEELAARIAFPKEKPEVKS